MGTAMNFSVLPPDITSVQMHSGAGSGPMLAAAAAWDGLASELDSAANSFSSVTSGLATQGWQGPASQAMVAAAAPYAGWLKTAAAQASGAAAQAQSVAGVFESALAATVHPAVVAANRSNLVSLVMSNLFGQNAPAIAATEGQYEEMWAQDVAAMVGYHAGASAAAAQLTPIQLSELALSTFTNVGFLNIGFGNVGIGNTGIGNVGIDNFGTFNVGIGNNGSNNIGEFLTGNNQIGIGSLTVPG
jgi:PPE-repeat protein